MRTSELFGNNKNTSKQYMNERNRSIEIDCWKRCLLFTDETN